MRALLDTNAFLWFISGSDRLSRKALDYIADFNNDLVISTASLWEIAIKNSIGKLELLSPFDRLIIAQCITEKTPVVTSDGMFAKYPVEVIW